MSDVTDCFNEALRLDDILRHMNKSDPAYHIMARNLEIELAEAAAAEGRTLNVP